MVFKRFSEITPTKICVMLEALFEQSSSEATQKLKLLPNEEKKNQLKTPPQTLKKKKKKQMQYY